MNGNISAVNFLSIQACIILCSLLQPWLCNYQAYSWDFFLLTLSVSVAGKRLSFVAAIWICLTENNLQGCGELYVSGDLWWSAEAVGHRFRPVCWVCAGPEALVPLWLRSLARSQSRDWCWSRCFKLLLCCMTKMCLWDHEWHHWVSHCLLAFPQKKNFVPAGLHWVFRCCSSDPPK